MGRRKARKQWKSKALAPKKTQNFKTQNVSKQEGQRSLPPPPPLPLYVELNIQPENPCKDLMLLRNRADHDEGEEKISATIPVTSMSATPSTPFHLSIVPYKTPQKIYTHPTKKKGKKSPSNHWHRKKLETLTQHFNPIPFLRQRPLNIAAHRVLLKRLGLWDFLHIDFDQKIRNDLVKQLIIHYNPKRPFFCRSNVNGLNIKLSRSEMAHALLLPSKRHDMHGSDAAKDGFLMVSEEEALFVKELVWSWLVLKDNDNSVPDEVLKNTSFITERKLEAVDWAGLIWFMVNRELMKGKILVNCYYASHMQRLLKHQKPKLFADEDENMGFLDMEAAVGDESMLKLESPEMVKEIVSFKEEFQKDGCASVEENLVGVEEIDGEQKMEAIFVRCCGGGDSSMQDEKGKDPERNQETRETLIKEDSRDLKMDEMDNQNGQEIDNQQTHLMQDKGERELVKEVGSGNTLITENSITCMENQPADFALKEEVNQEVVDLNVSLEKGEGNIEPESSGLNEFRGAEIDSRQIVSSSEQETVEGYHVIESKQEDVVHLEYEEKNERHCELNGREGTVAMQYSTPRTLEEEIEIQSQKRTVEEVHCHDLPKEFPPAKDVYPAEHFGSQKVPSSLPNHVADHSLMESFGDMHMEMDNPPCQALHNKNSQNNEPFVEPFTSEPNIYFSLAGSSFDNSLKAEIDCITDGYYEHQKVTERRMESNFAHDDLLNLDLCTEQVEVWVAKLKSAARKQAQADNEMKTMLLNKIEEQNKIIHEYEKMKHGEQQKRQKEIRQYGYELYLMQSVVNDYRKALKETDKAFSKYREHCQCQLPQQPLYVDDPVGGGKVILASELENLKQRESEANLLNIEAMMDNFQHEWIGKLEGHVLKFDMFRDRLSALGESVKLLKEKVSPAHA